MQPVGRTFETSFWAIYQVEYFLETVIGMLREKMTTQRTHTIEDRGSSPPHYWHSGWFLTVGSVLCIAGCLLPAWPLLPSVTTKNVSRCYWMSPVGQNHLWVKNTGPVSPKLERLGVFSLTGWLPRPINAFSEQRECPFSSLKNEFKNFMRKLMKLTLLTLHVICSFQKTFFIQKMRGPFISQLACRSGN